MLTAQERDSWASALRRPEQHQIRGSLYGPNPDDTSQPAGFCCLGVYCAKVLNIPLDSLVAIGLPSEVDPADIMTQEEYTEYYLTEIIGIAPEDQTGQVIWEYDCETSDAYANYLDDRRNESGPSYYEQALDAYSFDLTVFLTDEDREEHTHYYEPEHGTRIIKKGAHAFAFMNDTLKWSFARIANIVAHLPVRKD